MLSTRCRAFYPKNICECSSSPLSSSHKLRAIEQREERERFIDVLAHDLRNPLNAISVAAEVLAPEDPQQQKFVATIGRSADRIRAMVDDLADFTRGRLGFGLALDLEPTVVQSLLESVVSELAMVHGAHRLQVVEGPKLGTAYWDSERVAQLLSNLLANALTHSRPESVVVVQARAVGDRIEFEITNEGHPIPPERLVRLFEPFVRGSGANQPAGMGLGLFIARTIVEAHGGELTASCEGDTTRFTASLPLKAAQ